MKEFINSFIKSTKEVFPVLECVNKTEEEGVYESQNYYLCLLIDRRFKGEFYVKILRPYIWKSENECSYAWLDRSGNFYDNYDNPIHMDDEVVVGFKSINYDEDMEKSINEYWQDIIDTEDSYYD